MPMLSLNGVHLRPPREDEFAFLVELRNRERRWFADQSKLEHDHAAAWIAARHDDDRLNCIISNEAIIGTIGWVRVPTPGVIYELGRLIGGYQTARKHGLDNRQLYKDLRVGCCLAIDYLFGKLQAEIVYVRIRPENTRVRNMIREFGLLACTWPFSPSAQELECWRTVAAEWAIARNNVLKQGKP